MISPWARAGVGQGFGQGHSRCSGPLRNGRIAVMKMKNLTAAGALLVIGVALTGCGGVIRIGGPDQTEEDNYKVAKDGSLSAESGNSEHTVHESNCNCVNVVEEVHRRGDDKPKAQHPL